MGLSVPPGSERGSSKAGGVMFMSLGEMCESVMSLSVNHSEIDLCMTFFCVRETRDGHFSDGETPLFPLLDCSLERLLFPFPVII